MDENKLLVAFFLIPFYIVGLLLLNTANLKKLLTLCNTILGTKLNITKDTLAYNRVFIGLYLVLLTWFLFSMLSSTVTQTSK